MNIIVKPHGDDLYHCRPDTTWERENKDFYSPDCVNEVYWTPVIFARICKAGKCVGNKFAERYYDGAGCGILLYCATGQSGISAEKRGIVSCADHTSIFPMPLYDPMVMNKNDGFTVIMGNGEIAKGHADCEVTPHYIVPAGQGEWRNLLEEAICGASKLTSLRIGDFVAVELEGMKLLTGRELGNCSIKGSFCGNEIFDFKVII